jgi:sphingolipid C9-methyltransferase
MHSIYMHILSLSVLTGGDDFYEWFLGPRMVYTSGVVLDLEREETLEELQDNKLTLVCEKLSLQPTDRLLDIGCGWGTLAAFAAKNYGCDVTGVTLAKKQTKFGNDRIVANGADSERARILCCDYRDIPVSKGHYTKIVSLEMAEVLTLDIIHSDGC